MLSESTSLSNHKFPTDFYFIKIVYGQNDWYREQNQEWDRDRDREGEMNK